MAYNGEDMIGMSEDEMLKQDVKIMCDKIMGTTWKCLTEAEWKDIESRALNIGHYPDILNA